MKFCTTYTIYIIDPSGEEVLIDVEWGTSPPESINQLSGPLQISAGLDKVIDHDMVQTSDDSLNSYLHSDFRTKRLCLIEFVIRPAL